MQRCPKCGEHHHVKDCNQYESCCANCNERHSVAYKGCQKYKEAKLKARAASYAEALKNKPENKNKERAQKIASDAQTQIENNLQSMLWSHFTKLGNKIAIKLLGLYLTNIYVSPRLEIKTDLITKIANDEGHLLTGDINVKHPMFGAYDLTTNRTGKLIEQWLDEENYIILNNYDCTHKDGGTLDVHLANPKLTSLFDNFYVLNESPSNHYPTVSNYNIDKPIESYKKINWQRYKNHILHTSEDLDRNITNKIDLEKNIDKITQKISIGIQRGPICQQTHSHKPPNQKN